MAARIIINADDFGMTPGINRAVAELAQAGVLSSATLMASGAAFEQAAAIAHSLPSLGVGCHLVFVDGIPISPPQSIPSLLGPDRRSFRPSLVDFIQAALLGDIRNEDLASETEAQITRLQHAGIAPTHVDSHKHTHMIPSVTRAVLHTARRCGVPRFRNPFEARWCRQLSRHSASLSRRLPWSLLQTLAPAFQRQLQPFPAWATTAGTLGLLATGSLTSPLLRSFVSLIQDASLPGKPGPVFELCVHPGHVDDALQDIATRLRASREQEYEMLLSTVPQLVASPGGLTLINFGDLHP